MVKPKLSVGNMDKNFDKSYELNADFCVFVLGIYKYLCYGTWSPINSIIEPKSVISIIHNKIQKKHIYNYITCWILCTN